MTGDWAGYDRAVVSLLRVPNVTLGVGVPDSQHPGPRSSKHPVTYAKIAEVNEYGDDGMAIPARPIFGPAMDRNEDSYMDAIREALDGAVRGEDFEDSLNDLAEQMADDVRSEIESGDFEPLAESTVERKGHDQPWIETNALYDAIEGHVQLEVAQFDHEARRFRDSRGRFKRVRGM